MQRYQISLIQHKFHIDGFPDVVKVIFIF